MTKDQIKELAEKRGTSVSEVEALIQRGEQAKRNQKFTSKKGEGHFTSPKELNMEGGFK